MSRGIKDTTFDSFVTAERDRILELSAKAFKDANEVGVGFVVFKRTNHYHGGFVVTRMMWHELPQYLREIGGSGPSLK